MEISPYFVIIIVSTVFGLLGFTLGRGQAARFYDSQIDYLMEVIKDKRRVIKHLRKEVDNDSEWWKNGEESPY